MVLTSDGCVSGYDAGKLIYEFNGWLDVAGSVVTDLLGKDKGASALEDIRKNFESLIPRIPWIGGDSNPNTYNLLGSAYSMGLIAPLEALGVKPREIGHTIYLMSATSFQMEKTAMERRGAGMVATEALNYMRDGAAWSRKRTYPADFVFDFVEPQAGTVYGIDMTECAVQKFYRAVGLGKYVRYNCLVDYPMFQSMKVPLGRTETLGNGAAKCDFRFLTTGTTPDGWPPETRPEFKGDP